MTLERPVPARLRLLAALLTVAAGAGAPRGPAAGPELAEAHKLYNSTDYDGSLRILLALPAKDGPVWELMGRDYYMQADYKKATAAFERAFALDPANPDYALWLGRAWGRRAELSSAFTAPFEASKARQYLEKSVELNPMNLDAQSDLFEYYLDAPGFLGGGLDRAEKTAADMAKISPAEGQWAEAKLAERRKQTSSAEAHLRRAVELGPQQVGKLIELARFLMKQGRYQEADQNFDRAESLAPGSPRLIFARAETYIQAHHKVEVARELLKRYLNMSVTADDPPKSEAAKLLHRAQGS